MPEGVPSLGSAKLVEPQIGELFAGRYRIDRILGRGMTGTVWAAHDEEVGDSVALKLLMAGPDDAIDRFRREVRVARRVTHRNAARIFDLGAAQGMLYLTMELVDGESLSDRLLKESPMGVPRVLDIGSQVASGLAAAHEVGVIHRDIKPANVMISASGRVVVTDFGLARGVAGDSNVTLGPTMMGTPSYMAPEQVRGEALGPAADLYALGAVLYEMLTGRCPFVRDSVVATAMARLHEQPEDPRQYASIPDELAGLVLECLERDSARRPESAARVAARLAAMSGKGANTDAIATLYSPAILSASPTQRAGNPGVASTFISVAPQDRTLAVLPFRYRGTPEHSYLVESLAEDLIDTLSTTRGMRVASFGATAKYEGQSVDPREAGRELGADAIVDGTAQVVGTRLRISARLIDVATSEQLWFLRFDEALSDCIDLMETIALRIAENLRVELEMLNARYGVDEEVVELLREALRRTEGAALADGMFDAGLELIEHALVLAPDFALALAMHAEMSVRRWFLPSGQKDTEVARSAHESVDRALSRAPDVARTHYAAGRLAVSDGRWADAAAELTLALTIAPTYAVVHDYLGSLQCEAGRGDEGVRHIELALKIDPTLPVGPSLARQRALAGDLDSYSAMVAVMRKTPSVSRFMLDSLELRVAGWNGDLETVRRCRPASYIPPNHPTYRFWEAQRAALLGETSGAELLKSLEVVLKAGSGPRLDAFMRQLAIEALAPIGALESAMDQLNILIGSPAFLDTDWMERCAALGPLRDQPDYGELVTRVHRRADAIWRVRS